MNSRSKIFIALIFILSFKTARSQSDDLFRKVAALDSIFFKAYNECDIPKQESIYSDSIEFYHDKGGLSTSKHDLIEATKKNICGKVTRELVKGSLEISPIPGYGAVEVGLHMFHNKLEPDAIPKPSRFIIIWKNNNDKWTITRVISLH